MPHFTHMENLNVVWRRHEFNVEALDGRILLIPDDEPTYIVTHHPNKKWSYNVGWTKKITPELALEEVKLLGPKSKTGPDKPALYYDAVTVKEYENYVETHGFEDTVQPIKTTEVTSTIIEAPKPHIIDLSNTGPPAPEVTKEITKVTSRLPRESSEGMPKMAFTGTPVYTFKPPGRR